MKLGTGNERLKKDSHGKVICLCLDDKSPCQIIVRNRIGSAQSVFDQGFRKTTCKIRFACRNQVAKLKVVLEGGTVVKRSRRIDRPFLTSDP